MMAGDAVDYLLGNGGGERNLSKDVVKLPDTDAIRYSQLQFAPALLKYREQAAFKPLQIVELDPEDPWRGVYAACLGTLPAEPSPQLLAEGRLIPDLRFEDFLNVERVQPTGSFTDLLARVGDSTCLTPKQIAMYNLPNRNPHGRHFSAGDHLLPPRFPARDEVGPYVLVVCSAGDVRDLALLWNLRSKFGDFETLPIGVLVGEVDEDALLRVVDDARYRQSSPQGPSVHLTSISLSRAELETWRAGLGERIRAYATGIVDAEEILHLGRPAGWDRRDVVTWQDGKAKIPMVPAQEMNEILQHEGFGHLTALSTDIEVPVQPFPCLSQGHVNGVNADFAAGLHTKWRAGRPGGRAQEIHWPSRMLMARAVARKQGLDLRESTPGLSSRLLIEGLGGLDWVTYLLHKPLLQLLQDMAAREGMSWQRRRNRERGADPIHPRDAIAPSPDQLTEVHSDRFREALGRNTDATVKWLDWAERAGLIVKGMRAECRYCHATQWLPVNAFAPPLTCRGCGRTIDQPFPHHASAQFWYRISERLRRVYEHDAMGHILACHWFAMAFSSGGPETLLGVHPGLEVVDVKTQRVVGEVDVMLMAADGKLIPIEVKSSVAGVTDEELAKLNAVAGRLQSPWTGTVVAAYGAQGGFDSRSFERCRTSDQRYEHINLAYDHLLNRHPLLRLGGDPFEAEPLSYEAIQDREAKYVQTLSGEGALGTFNWIEHELLDFES
ncbi:hypothetical protein [Demequina sp. NBRC 110054]|uniref:hypothetical protein n=1 Tax=Demequina sp. NBRC 110054 TaxID=1570343 RepID=UPI0009FF7DAE|nr:hypothetical protein [Demequina sp. NBRC 110054]